MTGYNIYGYDVIGLRGYSDGSLTPYDPQDPYAYANVYNKYTLELRYPFLQQPATHIYGLVFAEAGNGYRNWQEFDPFKLHRSLGVGIRVYIPFIGMIGLDWGYGSTVRPAPRNRTEENCTSRWVWISKSAVGRIDTKTITL